MGDRGTWRGLTLYGTSAMGAGSLLGVSLLELLLDDDDDDDEEGFEDDDDEGFDDDPEDPLPDELDDDEPLLAPSDFDRSAFSFSFRACILASFSFSFSLSAVSFASLDVPEPDPGPEPELDLLSPLAFSALSFSLSACILASFCASRVASVDEPELGLAAGVALEDGAEDEVRDEVDHDVDVVLEVGDVLPGALSSCETIWRVKNSNNRNPRVLLTWRKARQRRLGPRANSATWSQSGGSAHPD